MFRKYCQLFFFKKNKYLFRVSSILDIRSNNQLLAKQFTRKYNTENNNLKKMESQYIFTRFT